MPTPVVHVDGVTREHNKGRNTIKGVKWTQGPSGSLSSRMSRSAVSALRCLPLSVCEMGAANDHNSRLLGAMPVGTTAREGGRG